MAKTLRIQRSAKLATDRSLLKLDSHIGRAQADRLFVAYSVVQVSWPKKSVGVRVYNLRYILFEYSYIQVAALLCVVPLSISRALKCSCNVEKRRLEPLVATVLEKTNNEPTNERTRRKGRSKQQQHLLKIGYKKQEKRKMEISSSPRKPIDGSSRKYAALHLM